MESNLLAAPNQHSIYFKSFIEQLAERFEPIQIFCFSKRSYLSETSGVFIDTKSSIKVDYCLLFVTATNTRIDSDVQDHVNRVYQDGYITVLCHGKKEMLTAIKKNSRFFSYVYSSGELIYNKGHVNYDLTHNFDSINLVEKAKKHYENRINLAKGFLAGAKECLEKQHFNVCAFMLHQVVEQCCIGLIRVFIGYRSETHNLDRLLHLCSSFSNIPRDWFFNGRLYEQRLFEILCKSYYRSRYGKTFIVNDIDARCLFEKVSEFYNLTDGMCLKKIKDFESKYSIEESEVQSD